MALVKCPICEKQIEKETAVQIGKRYYCVGKCSQRKAEIDKESEHYRDLIAYCCNLCDVDEPYIVWLSLIKKYREDYKFTSKGIMLTLKFFYEYKDNPKKDLENILGIVPYYYDKARNDYIQRLEAKKAFKQFMKEGKELVTHEKVVVTFETVKETKNSAKRKHIDISKFVLEEEIDDETTI